MGTVSLNKQNRLFWLGRYSERVYACIQMMQEQYDRLIDGDSMDYQAFCQGMGIPCPYEDGDDFCNRYLFDTQDVNSVISSVEAMLGNGMVLRETITTPTLAYLQMARNAMVQAAGSSSPGIQLQWVLDDIMAFRGSFDDSVDHERIRNITKSGVLVERISLLLRVNWHEERLGREISKLLNRLYKTNLPLNQDAVDAIFRHTMGEKLADRLTLLNSVEGLFLV